MKEDLDFPSLPSFDDLKTLASKDPKALSDLRKYYCDSFINSVPEDHQHRLYCLQNRVELELQRAKNPMSGIIMLSGMMHQSVGKLADGFNRMGQTEDEEVEVRLAEVIPFQRPSSNKPH